MKPLIKKVVAGLFGPYEIYSIYRSGQQAAFDVALRELEVDDLQSSPHDEIRALASYRGEDARCFGLEDNGDLVCACWYWYGETYATRRGFVDLPPGSAKLVQITTAKTARGKQLARTLIAGSTARMMALGFDPLYARIWRGHTASERAFTHAGWRKTGTIITFQLFGRPVRLKL